MSSKQTSDNLKEFQVFADYIVSKKAKPEIAQRYYHILSSSGVEATDRYLVASLNHPWLLPYLDSYLAVVNPFSALRERLYIAFSVLESDPEFSDDFLSKHRPKIYMLYIALIGIRSIYRFIAGVLIAGIIKILL